jgi:hypothetical protein
MALYTLDAIYGSISDAREQLERHQSAGSEPAKDSNPDPAWQATKDELEKELARLEEAAAEMVDRIKSHGYDQTLQIRFALRPATARSQARRRLHSTEAVEWFKEETGLDPADAETWPEDERHQEAIELFNAATRIARAVAAIERIETRQIDLLDHDPNDYDGEGWSEEPIPETWLDISQAVETVPIALADEINAQANMIGRGYVARDFLPRRPRKEPAAKGKS